MKKAARISTDKGYIDLPLCWNDLSMEQLGRIEPEAALQLNLGRVLGDTLVATPELLNQACLACAFLLYPEALFTPTYMSQSDFRQYQFRQWVEAMAAIRKASDGGNQFKLLEQVATLFAVKGATVEQCQTASAIIEHSVKLAESLAKMEFPKNPKAEKAMAGKFEHYHEINYIFALAEGKPSLMEAAGMMTIENAEICLYYAHSSAWYNEHLQQLLQSGQGSR